MINTITEYNVLNTPWPLEDNSVDCCITSPPYYGLRDYGVAGQLGQEKTPEEYVDRMVAIFNEVKRVLKATGTCWLNLGDSYANNRGSGKSSIGEKQATNEGANLGKKKVPAGYKDKDLFGIPWAVAFALRSAGWYLRQDIIWHKPNPMPESVTDRCTKAHEYIFLLSKSSKYYFNADSIREAGKNPEDDKRRIYQQSVGSKSMPDELRNGLRPRKTKIPGGWDTKDGSHGTIHRSGRTSAEYAEVELKDGANKRSVWSVATAPFPEAHFATFPEQLITPCVLAGCPKDGIILDPFMGAGTTALVAKSHGRNYIGFELNPEYIRIAENRLKKEFGMFHKTG